MMEIVANKRDASDGESYGPGGSVLMRSLFLFAFTALEKSPILTGSSLEMLRSPNWVLRRVFPSSIQLISSYIYCISIFMRKVWLNNTK